MEKEQINKEDFFNHLLCPYCYHKFNIPTPLFTNLTLRVTCPQCDSIFYSRPVVFSNPSYEGLKNVYESFLKNQRVNGLETRPLGEICGPPKPNKEE